MPELIEKDLLFRIRIFDPLGLAADGEKIDVNADQLIHMRVAHARGGDAAPIAALHREALVAERVGHEFRETIRHLLYAEALLPRPEREAVAGQGRRDDREGV